MSVEYKEYGLVGGQAARIIPLIVSEAGTYFAPEGCAFNPVVVQASGGSSVVGTAIVGTSTVS